MATRTKVTQILEATGGGTRRHLRDLVFGLDRQLFELSIICSGGRDADFDDDVAAMQDAGISVYDLPMSSRFSPICDRISTQHMVRLLREIKPDVVHTHSTKAGWIGRKAAHACGIRKRVHSPHCWPFEIRGPRLARRLVARIEQRLARCTDLFVCCCQAEKSAALERTIAPADRLRVIPNGVPLPGPSGDSSAGNHDAFSGTIPDGTFVIGVVGRLYRQKGQGWFLDAVAAWVRQTPGICIVFIGDGPDREPLAEKAVKLGIAPKCRFVGQVQSPQGFYRRLDVVVLPSLWEGLPYVLLEAMRAGKAILATAVGGMTEVLADDAGLLIPAEDAPQMGKALRGLMTHPARRVQLGRRAAERVCSYSLEKMVYGIQELYQHV